MDKELENPPGVGLLKSEAIAAGGIPVGVNAVVTKGGLAGTAVAGGDRILPNRNHYAVG